jgi:xylulokinase
MDCLNIIEGMGIETGIVMASGGGSRSPFWRQILSDVFDREIWTVENSEGPALGAAILAGVGAGIYRDVPEGCDAAVSAKKSCTPSAAGHEIYMKYYGIYRKLYPALKELFKEL